jgi:TPR repeat protein
MGTRQDYAEAFKWYKQSGDKGLADAQLWLGVMYEAGQGIPQNYSEAAKWYRKSADQGDPDAQWSLSIMYDKGWGVVQDYVAAHMWANLSASKASEIVRKESVKLRDQLASKMTPQQIAEAQRLAREWKPTPAR